MHTKNLLVRLCSFCVDPLPAQLIHFIPPQVSVAMGCAARDRTVAFASTFAAFLSRAYDHVRMGAISQSNVNLCGSHCGVSIGESVGGGGNASLNF